MKTPKAHQRHSGPRWARPGSIEDASPASTVPRCAVSEAAAHRCKYKGQARPKTHVTVDICSAWNTYCAKANRMVAGPIAASSAVPAHWPRLTVSTTFLEGRGGVCVARRSAAPPLGRS